ncbi:acyl-CoA dehydrogenase family protein [Micromonospora radicis]|uniref:Acyl-CoA dehydrogenase n=1 Tax=Micromonospora radicis TaxID=1894971 RepID=A0A418MYR0_9ACTN|nr:acyl-CoA/acyl-ACP dehydrogenase [Micromonospora radicis]RIV40318.1 acyl-CoA dehydrogenase [Micromonospora radicis]
MTVVAHWTRPYDAARSVGVEAALADLYDRVAGGALVAGPAGQALAPGPVGRAAERVWPGGAPLRGLDGATTVALPAPVRDADLAAFRGLPGPDGPGWASYRAWLLGLAWLRLGCSAGLLDRIRTHLAGRRAADGPLLRQQLVQATLAEAVTDQLTVEALLTDADPDADSVADLVQAHHQLTAADHALLPVLGAAGFTGDGPGRAVYLSHLLADVYLPAHCDVRMPA